MMNRSTIYYRIVLDLAVLLFIIHGAWLLALPVAFISAWVFPLPLELIAAGFIFDSLFGMAPALGAAAFAGTAFGAALFAVSVIFKRVVRR